MILDKDDYDALLDRLTSLENKVAILEHKLLNNSRIKSRKRNPLDDVKVLGSAGEAND